MQDEPKVDKFIVFRIADYLLGLPIGDVLKIVHCSAVTNRGLRTMGFVQIGRHMLRVLDLHEQLGAKPYLAPTGGSPQLLKDQPFLVITRGREGELCGILVDEPPNLVELSLEMIQSLPPSDDYGKGGLAFMSHAAVVTHEQVTTTIFLLDVKRVPNVAMNDSSLLFLQPW